MEEFTPQTTLDFLRKNKTWKPQPPIRRVLNSEFPEFEDLKVGDSWNCLAQGKEGIYTVSDTRGWKPFTGKVIYIGTETWESKYSYENKVNKGIYINFVAG